MSGHTRIDAGVSPLRFSPQRANVVVRCCCCCCSHCPLRRRKCQVLLFDDSTTAAGMEHSTIKMAALNHPLVHVGSHCTAVITSGQCWLVASNKSGMSSSCAHMSSPPQWTWHPAAACRRRRIHHHDASLSIQLMNVSRNARFCQCHVHYGTATSP